MRYSVIIPVYNRPDEVDELLQSLTQQSFKDFEVIVVEDGSSIPCKPVTEKYQELLDVHYYDKPNSGPGQTRNYGVERSKGEYLIILDSDCILPEGYFLAVEEELQHEAADAFGGPEAAFDPYANMVVGTDILSYLIRRTGNVRRALKWYSGAANLEDDRGYGARVMREHGLLTVAAEGRTDAAVKLHRAGKSASEGGAGNAAKLGFAHWTKLSERTEGAPRARNADLRGKAQAS